MKFIYNDGGRSNYFKGTAGDCVTRAICNATGLDYKEVYNTLFNSIKEQKNYKGAGKRGSTPRNGVPIKLVHKFLENVLGWVWHPTMKIGQGCTVHLAADELPSGTLIVQVSGHLTCVKDGVLHDTYDCTRDGSRCVYGYWTAPNSEDLKAKQRKEEIQAKIKAVKAELKALEKQLAAC